MEVLDDELVTMMDACRQLPVSLSYLYALAKENKISVVRIGSKMFIRKSVLDKLRTEGTPVDGTPVIGGTKCQL